MGRLDALVHVDSDGTIVFKQDFDVASDGTRTGVLETRGSTDVQWDYEYDELGRLVAERRDANDDGSYEYEVEYSYDVDSNRTSEYFKHTNTTRTYAYVTGTQRLSSITVNSTVREAFTWTTDGEQATHIWYDTNGDEEKKQTYTWSVFDTLTQVDFHEWDGAAWDYQGTLAYTYDDTNTLIRRQQYDQFDVLQDDVKYLIDTQNLTGYSQVLAEIDGQTDQLRRLNTYADEIKAEQVSNSSAYSYLRTDALGSIRSLTGTNASGSPLSESYNYTAFGSPFAGDDGDRSLTNYAFTGQVRDGSSELQYHRARWLEPSPGHWLSTDPLHDFPGGLGGGYAYCGANPANRSDATGAFTFLEAQVVQGIVSYIMEEQLGYLHEGLASSTIGEVRESDAAKFTQRAMTILTITALFSLGVVGLKIAVGIIKNIPKILKVGLSAIRGTISLINNIRHILRVGYRVIEGISLRNLSSGSLNANGLQAVAEFLDIKNWRQAKRLLEEAESTKDVAVFAVKNTKSGLHYIVHVGPGGRIEKLVTRVTPDCLRKGSGAGRGAREVAAALGNDSDDGGHIIGRLLGGSGGKYSLNIFPQLRRVNRGAYAQFEKKIARAIEDSGRPGLIRIDFTYPGDGTRPVSVDYTCHVGEDILYEPFMN